MNIDLSFYVPYADAFTALIHPHAEAVIHDFSNDKIFYISNSFSGREVGDLSNLKEEGVSDLEINKDVIGPYEKIGINGERLRSITIMLKNTTGDPIGILCININFAVLESSLKVLEEFFNPINIKTPPDILFRTEWKERILIEIRSFLKMNEQTKNLNAKWRKRLLTHLDGKGLFYAKKSVEEVAIQLGISRSTVYNNLNEVRNSKKN